MVKGEDEEELVFKKDPRSDFFDKEELGKIYLFENFTGRHGTFKRNGRYYKKDAYLQWEKKNFGTMDDDEVPDSETIAREILKTNFIYCPTEYRDDMLYYKDGYYHEMKNDYMDMIILTYLREKNYSHNLSDGNLMRKMNVIRRIIRADRLCSVLDFDGYEQYDGLINVKNGILDLSDLNDVKLLPHDPKYKMRIQIEAKYDPNAKSPKISKQVNLVTGEKNAPLFYQSIGDGLLGNPSKYEKMLILVGESKAGKSGLLYFIRRLYGNRNVTSHSLQAIQNDKFVQAELENKLGNLGPELPKTYIKEDSKIKEVTGETLSGNKKYGRMFNFINHCMHFFSTNQLPKVANLGDGFFRRFNIIVCYRKIKDKDIIQQYERKICTEEELSGLLNLAINGLKELEKNGGYPINGTDLEQLWDTNANPLTVFLEQYIDYYEYEGIEESHEIEIDLLFEVYNEFLKQNGLSTIKQSNVLSRIINRQRRYKIRTRRYRKNGIKKRVYTNIEFNENAKEVFDFKYDVELDVNDFELEEDIN